MRQNPTKKRLSFGFFLGPLFHDSKRVRQGSPLEKKQKSGFFFLRKREEESILPRWESRAFFETRVPFVKGCCKCSLLPFPVFSLFLKEGENDSYLRKNKRLTNTGLKSLRSFPSFDLPLKEKKEDKGLFNPELKIRTISKPLPEPFLKGNDQFLPLSTQRAKKGKGPITKAPWFFKGTNSYLLPDFVEIQRKSFFQLLENGLIEEFAKRNPITNKNLEIFFYPEYYQLTPPEYNPRRAILISKSYSSKLFIPVQLTDKKLKKSQLKWVLIGSLPLMTKRGHFVLNGAPRVIVNQILRSPGIYFQGSLKEIFSDQWSEKAEITYKRFYTDLICLRGTWLRIEIDKNKDIWAQMKKVPKIPLLWFLLAMGLTERIIFKSVINPTRLLANFDLETKRKIEYEYVTNASDAWKQISNLISSSNKESYTALSTPLTTKKKGVHPTDLSPLQSRFPLKEEGEVPSSFPLKEGGGKETGNRTITPLQNRSDFEEGASRFFPHLIKGKNEKLEQLPNQRKLTLKGSKIKNRMSFLHIVEHSKEGRNWIFKRFMNSRAYDLGSQGRLNFNRKLGLAIASDQTTLTAQDVLFATDYLFKVEKGLKNIDDIDHLKNRRVRTSGELLQIQIGIGLVRLEKIIRDKLSKINAQTRGSDFVLKKPSLPLVFPPSLTSSPPSLTFPPPSLTFPPPDPFSPPALKYGGENVRAGGGNGYGEEKRKSGGKNDKLEEFREPVIRTMTERKEKEQIRNKKSGKEIGIMPEVKKKGNQSRIQKAQTLLQSQKRGEEFKINNLINTKAFNGALREFFGSSQLSQFMDQLNPLAEITHKRRLSSMGPGGVTRDSATLAIRGIHPTHYGRICPIETPEGKNTGLVNSLTTFARASSQGFLESPFYKVYKGQIQKNAGMFFLSAEQEENIKLAAADVASGASGRINFLPKNKIPAKIASGDTISKISRNIVEYIGVSPIQMISIATSLIPFLEHDDANRALMGSNMQRQAVPLVRAERPLVGTGLESRTVSDSGHAVLARQSGYVAYVSAKKMVIYTISM